jgi:hypothetical protein
MLNDPTSTNSSSANTPDAEDARRRFILALRGMTVRKTKDEEQERYLADWSRDLREVVAEYKKRRNKRNVRTALGIVAVALMVVGAKMGISTIIFIAFAFGGSAAANSTSGKNGETFAGALARSRDPRSLNALAIAARDGDPVVVRVVTGGLKSLLPTLRSSDAGHISDKGMIALLDLLKTNDPELLIAILRGLEQIGDRRAVDPVKSIAESARPPFSNVVLLVNSHDVLGRRRWKTSQADWDRVREQAQRTLEFLNQRTHADRMRTTLLRPAMTGADQSQSLLRPASFTSNAPNQQLLRPMGSQEDAQPAQYSVPIEEQQEQKLYRQI